MIIRKSEIQDLERMQEIYAHARDFMARHGNPDQWGATHWPPEALLRRDIAEGNSYVCLDGDGKIVGTFFYVSGEDIEPTYREITEGAWRDAGPYGVVHRIASDGSVKGVGSFCISWAYGQCGHLRIDTHGDNTVMQGLLGKLGFVRCGTIYVEEDDAPRMAYELSPSVRRAEQAADALIGQAAGDAFGVPAEFMSREAVRRLDLREMAGCDRTPPVNSRWGNRIPAGSWSDDTSMTVASMASVVRNGGRIDWEDQMRQFVRWWDSGEYCSLDFPFGLGGNVSASMDRFRAGTPALRCGGTRLMDNGNGALMRILPISLYCIFNGLDAEETVRITGEGSAITHGHGISRICCFIWTEFLRAVAAGEGTDGAVDRIEGLPYAKWFPPEILEAVRFVTGKRVRSLTEEDIGETGYVADTLYTALYSLCHAEDYETAIRNAVNMGYDTDTAAAVTGTAAGMLYGRKSIPEKWLEALKKKDVLEKLAGDFAACAGGKA